MANAEQITEAMQVLTQALDDAFDDICLVGWTYGAAYSPFDPDREDRKKCSTADVPCQRLWTRISGISADPGDGWGNDCGASYYIDFEVGVERCYSVPSKGAAPTVSDVLVAAATSVEDMNKILCTVMNTPVWIAVDAGAWTPTGPRGANYGGIWTFTARLS